MAAQARQNKQTTSSSSSGASVVSIKSKNQFDTASIIKSFGITKSSSKDEVKTKIAKHILNDILEDGLSNNGKKYGMSISKLENGKYVINGNKFSSLDDFRVKLLKDQNFKPILQDLIKDMFDRIQNHLGIEFNQTIINSHKSRISEIDVDKKGVEKNIAKLNKSIQESNEKYTSLLSNMYSIKRQHESDMMAVSKNIADANTAYSKFMQSKLGQQSQTNAAIGNLIQGQSNILASLTGLQQNATQQQNAALDAAMRAQQSLDDRRQRAQDALSKQEADYYANLAKMNADYSNTTHLADIISSGVQSVQNAVIASANASIAATKAASDANIAGLNQIADLTKAASDANIAAVTDLTDKINDLTTDINKGFDDLKKDYNAGIIDLKKIVEKIIDTYPPTPGVPPGCNPNILRTNNYGTLNHNDHMQCTGNGWNQNVHVVVKKSTHPQYNSHDNTKNGPFKLYYCNAGGHWCCSDGNFGSVNNFRASSLQYYNIIK